jgi:nicotinamidase-related amidase
MTKTLSALPKSVALDTSSTAAIFIDMQKDFILPGGFGEALGNDVDQLLKTIEPCKQLLDICRSLGIAVIHTREGHRPDLSDVFENKLNRAEAPNRIGDVGPMGRILIRGEDGHDFVDELRPISGELIIEKAGKGAFYSTELELILRKLKIETLIFAGVTTEVCVSSTVREANDRGFNNIVVQDCCGSYFPKFHEVALEMICAQGGIFGSVCSLSALSIALS